MSLKHLNTNKQFMAGNALLAFAVFFIVIIFIYMSFRLKTQQDANRKYTATYKIELQSGFLNHSFKLQLNDSIIFNETVDKNNLILTIQQFEADNSLLVIDNKEDKLAGIFPLKKDKSEHLILVRKDKTVSLKK